MKQPGPTREYGRVRSVGGEFRLLFRVIAAIAVALLVCNVGPRLFLLGQLRPQVQRLQMAENQLDVANAGLVDEETGLRGYLATGVSVFLQPYTSAVPKVSAASVRLSELVPHGRLASDFEAMRNALRQWDSQWARLAVDPGHSSEIGAAAGGQLDVGLLTEFFDAGKVLFDRYRVMHDRLEKDISAALSRADRTQTSWLVWSGAVQALIAIAGLAAAFAASHRLRRLVALPVASLAKTVAEIRSGNLTARVPIGTAPAELLALSADVDQMAAALQTQSELVRRRGLEVQRHSDRLHLVLGVAREVAGSLSLRYVLDAVTVAVCQLGSTRARVWLVEADERTIALSFDTDTGVKNPLPYVRLHVGVGAIGRLSSTPNPSAPSPPKKMGRRSWPFP